MSKNRSPGDGGGSEASPRSSSIGAPGSGQQELVLQPVLAAALELDPGLLVDPRQGGRADVLRAVGPSGVADVAERLEGRDAALDECSPLTSGDPGDQAQVVVRAAAGDAFGGPATDVAVLDRLGVGAGRRVGRRRLIGERGEEAVACTAVVGHEVVHPQALDRPRAAAKCHVQPLGPDALDPLELVDVRADLEDGARLDVAGELRVGDLVVVRPPARRLVRVVHPEQEVGVAAQRAIEECRLVDHVGASRHRVDGLRGGGAELLAAVGDRAVLLDLDDVAAGRAQLREEARLVLEAPSADDVELRVVAHRPLDEPGQSRALELGQVLAGEVGDEVRGRIDRPAVDAIHAAQPYQRTVTARLSRPRDSIRS